MAEQRVHDLAQGGNGGWAVGVVDVEADVARIREKAEESWGRRRVMPSRLS
jgi:hypothetical protein